MRTRFGVRRPRIGVAGLNPHAGEDGSFGSEERTVIAPAVTRALRLKSVVTGPVPPDSVFALARQGRYDLVFALYHGNHAATPSA